MKRLFAIACALFLAMTALAKAEVDVQKFSCPVGSIRTDGVIQVPYITWGGDVATFAANGGLSTTPDSIYGKLGLKLKLTAGDDFVAQVKDYCAGRTPFLRGTTHQIGLASEAIAADPRTKGVMLMQLTWSNGDHCVAREQIKKIGDIKKVAIQRCAPELSMLDDILKTAQRNWSDIEIVWTKDLTGSNDSPAEVFRRDKSIDACFVISPDMLGLCGGLQSKGDGSEGTVKGAHVLVSTAELSKSIADVYVVRKDFYDANRDLLAKFVAGYLKSCEELVEMKKQYEAKGSPQYMQILKMAQQIYGVKVLPTLENDAHGLVCDAAFVGYPGNVTFFTEKGNPNGFEVFQASALDLAAKLGYIKVKTGLFPSGLDYSSSTFIGYLKNTNVERKSRFKAEAVQEEIEALNQGATDDKTIYGFSVNFEANQDEFSALQYGAEFERVIAMMSKYGNAVVAIRGHSDPTKTMLDLIKGGIKKGIIKQTGGTGSYQYFYNGNPLNLSNTPDLIRLIEAGDFDGIDGYNPRETMQSALNLSRNRAEKVREAIAAYAKQRGAVIDQNQIQPVGVGIKEPVISKPKSVQEAAQNMRVEFRLLRVSAEATAKSDFDF